MSCSLSRLMSANIAHPPAPLNDLSYLPRVTTRDHRAIEEALAGGTLLTEAPQLDGVVIEAAYAASNPPLLKRLREDGIARIVDPQSLRLTGARFLEVDALAALTYAPDKPIAVDAMPRSAARQFSRVTLDFEQRVGCDVLPCTWFGPCTTATSRDGWLPTTRFSARLARPTAVRTSTESRCSHSWPPERRRCLGRAGFRGE